MGGGVHPHLMKKRRRTKQEGGGNKKGETAFLWVVNCRGQGHFSPGPQLKGVQKHAGKERPRKRKRDCPGFLGRVTGNRWKIAVEAGQKKVESMQGKKKRQGTKSTFFGSLRGL